MDYTSRTCSEKIQDATRCVEVNGNDILGYEGILLIDYLAKDTTMNEIYYANLIRKVRQSIVEKRRGKLSRGVLFLQDNAPSHTALVARRAVKDAGFEELAHPPYSPDLAPSDYFLFRNLKKDLRGRRFSDEEEMKSAVSQHFEGKPKEYFFNEIDRFRKNPALLFVPTQLTQCTKITASNEIGIFLEPLHAERQDFIFFALNVNEHTEYSGGTHWSLPVLSHLEKVVFHFDSNRKTNQEQAVELFEKLIKCFGLPSFECISEPVALQQSNGYDCGIHAFCNTENLANYALRYKKLTSCRLPDK